MHSRRSLSEVTSDLIARGGAHVLRTRWLMRAPIWAYRAHLGFVFGSRILMVEHLGRKSGTWHHVVLEVFGHPTPDTYIVASGFGEHAQWYRNVLADPRVRVWVGRHGPRRALAHRLDQTEADAALADYVARHTRAWGTFKSVIENTLGTTIRDHDTALPLIALTFTGGDRAATGAP